ncbi:hypothetical protein GC197_12425 [bacterium]|nr:hypothetical protein [bacterium]
MRPRLQVALSFLSLACLALFTGCNGDSLASVSGVVTLDGHPVRGLEVNFEPVDAAPDRTTGTGYTQADGSYSLHYPGYKKGTPPGDYIVRISGGESLDDGTRVRVPAKYNAKSELTETVVPGKNKFDFDLTSK